MNRPVLAPGPIGLCLRVDTRLASRGRTLVAGPDIIGGNYHIHWLEQFLARGGMEG
jgi:hypothetical protein